MTMLPETEQFEVECSHPSHLIFCILGQAPHGELNDSKFIYALLLGN